MALPIYFLLRNTQEYPEEPKAITLKEINHSLWKNQKKLIYSVKYLPQVLYFGTIAWLIYTIYYGDYLENEIQIFGYVWDGSLLKDTFFFWFLYITYLAAKNLKTKKEFGGKNKSQFMKKSHKIAVVVTIILAILLNYYNSL